MPTYQYACTTADCGNRFELVQSFSDPSVSECPVCGGAVRKVFSAVGVVFKGSGFYRTDSRAGSKPSETSSSTPAKESSSAAKESSSSDSSSKSGSTSTPTGTGSPSKAAASA